MRMEKTTQRDADSRLFAASRRVVLLLSALMMGGWTDAAAQPASARPAEASPAAHFSSFSYSGHDTRFDKAIDSTHQYFNPILAGFYPDPSVCRAGDTFYLVNFSFSFFPGVPLSTSHDLVNWTAAGYVLDRPSQLPLEGQHVSGGIFAPAISYNKRNKTFYMITTNVGRGNFFVKSKDPTKGWSEPVYLPEVDGIDPSFYFEEHSDRAFIVHNAPTQTPARYEGERAIRLLEFDTDGDSVVGGYTEILRSGTHVEEHPIWIEGPHLFKKGKYYYLMCAEGGTGSWHSEVVLRARDPYGPWEECPHNPILTQRTGLDPQRPDIVTSAGHADLVEDAEGRWWAVFLGCRPYQEDYYNTGRDTYLLPVTWRDGWPTILDAGKPVPTVNEKEGLLPQTGGREFSGNFGYTDLFLQPALDSRWMFLRNPSYFWTSGHGLDIRPLPCNIYEREAVSAVWTRQQHTDFSAETSLDFNPASEQDLAGMVLLQNEQNNFVMGITRLGGRKAVTLTRCEGSNVMVASAFVDDDATIRLRVEGRGRFYDFFYATGNSEWRPLAMGTDAINLSTHRSGGFIGACIGLYATSKNATEVK